MASVRGIGLLRGPVSRLTPSTVRHFALWRDVFSVDPSFIAHRHEVTVQEKKPVDPKTHVDTSASLYIAEQPPIPVEGYTAICYGAPGDVRGHPVQYIQLNRTKMDQPGTCKYCGLRFIHKHGLEKYNKTFETRQPDQSAIPGEAYNAKVDLGPTVSACLRVVVVQVIVT
eukprot:g3244.t1